MAVLTLTVKRNVHRHAAITTAIHSTLSLTSLLVLIDARVKAN